MKRLRLTVESLLLQRHLQREPFVSASIISAVKLKYVDQLTSSVNRKHLSGWIVLAVTANLFYTLTDTFGYIYYDVEFIYGR